MSDEIYFNVNVSNCNLSITSRKYETSNIKLFRENILIPLKIKKIRWCAQTLFAVMLKFYIFIFTKIIREIININIDIFLYYIF